MFGSTVLDVAIGMAFVYLLMSLIASVVQEIIATYLQLRPANLLRGVRSLFSGGTWKGMALADWLYNHGLVRGLYADPDHDEAPQAAAVGSSGSAAPMEAKATLKQAAAALTAAERKAQQAYHSVKTTKAALEDRTAQDQDSRLQAHNKARMELLEASEQVMASAELHKGAKAWVKAKRWVRSQQGILRAVARWVVRVPQTIPPAGVSNAGVLPAYIPSRTFAAAMVDILTPPDTAAEDVMEKVKAALAAQRKAVPSDKSVEAIYTLALNAGKDATKDLENFKKGLEGWYNDSMDRASGWYKRYTQKILLVVGLALAVCFNVDSVRVARTLWFDRDTRQAMVNAASEYEKAHPGKADEKATDGKEKTDPAAGAPASGPDASAAAASDASSGDAVTEAKRLKAKLDDAAKTFTDATNAALLPVGWKQPPSEYWNRGMGYLFPAKDAEGHRAARQWAVILPATWRCLALALGWLITGMAISAGAPFWFDTLNKFMVVRSTVKPQEKSQNEPSKS